MGKFYSYVHVLNVALLKAMQAAIALIGLQVSLRFGPVFTFYAT